MSVAHRPDLAGRRLGVSVTSVKSGVAEGLAHAWADADPAK